MVFNGISYNLVKNYREAYNADVVKEKITDYFSEYDFIFGDWSYGKVRLKGFYSEKHPKVSEINNISNLDEYIEKNCAYGCKYFLLEKEKKKGNE